MCLRLPGVSRLGGGSILPLEAPPRTPTRQEIPATTGRMRGETGVVFELGRCPLWVKSGHPTQHPFMSAFGGKADIECLLFQSSAFLRHQCLLLGRERILALAENHSPKNNDRKPRSRLSAPRLGRFFASGEQQGRADHRRFYSCRSRSPGRHRLTPP